MPHTMDLVCLLKRVVTLTAAEQDGEVVWTHHTGKGGFQHTHTAPPPKLRYPVKHRREAVELEHTDKLFI